MANRANVNMIPQPVAPHQPWAMTHAHYETLTHLLEDQLDMLQQILQSVKENSLRTSVEYSIAVPANSSAPLTLSANSRKHNRLWVETAQSTVMIGVRQGQFGSFSLVAGWNLLDLPEGSQIYAGGTAFSGLWQCSDASGLAGVAL